MDDALRVLIVNIVNKFTFCVLILVIMDNALRDQKSLQELVINNNGLNPCCNG